MALNQFEFVPPGGVTDKTAFPDDPGSGDALRAALQTLFDQLRDAHNVAEQELKSLMGAAAVGATQHQDIAASTVQEFLQQLADKRVTYKSGGARYIRINADNALETSEDGASWQATGSSGHIILDAAGTQLPQRSRLRFANSNATDNGTETVVNGIKGDKGDKGDRGEKGDIGNTGAQGPKGAAWYPGFDALGNLTFTLSETATPPPQVNLRGPQGVQGVQGAQGATGAPGVQGIQGPRGVQGVQGEKGDQGAQGPIGPQGAQGAPGVQGIKGEKGDQGTRGEKGETGTQGPTGPQGTQGVPGADGRSFVIQDVFATLGALKAAFPTGNEFAYQVSFDKNIYIWGELANDWISLGQLQGPQGPQGLQGVQGTKGDTGAQGERGLQGEQGPQGLQGVQGQKGDTGAQGERGLQGVQGVQGIQGETGAQGERGLQGVQGAAGKSAYQSATEAGYNGTEPAFNTSLAGIDQKASKTVPAASGNFAALNVSGDLMDSGRKHADYATKAVPAAAGNFAALNASGYLTDSGKKPADYAASNHTHAGVYEPANAAIMKTNAAQAMAAPMTAGGAQDVTVAQMRNITAGTADLTAGTSPLATGAIYFVYE